MLFCAYQTFHADINMHVHMLPKAHKLVLCFCLNIVVTKLILLYITNIHFDQLQNCLYVMWGNTTDDYAKNIIHVCSIKLIMWHDDVIMGYRCT